MTAIIRKTIFVTLLFCASLPAAGIRSNFYADQNREIFLLPRSAAMAGADLGSSRSATPLSNPANLCADSMHETSLSYASFFKNAYSTSALSFIAPVDDRSGIGIAVGYILVPGILISDGSKPVVYEDLSLASASDIIVRVGYGRRLFEEGDVSLSAGGAVTAERVNLVGHTGYGIGADAGIMGSLRRQGGEMLLSGGLYVENITTAVTRWSPDYTEYAPPHARIALGMLRELPYLYSRVEGYYCSPDILGHEGINHYAWEYSADGADVQVPEKKDVEESPFMLIVDARYGGSYTIMNTVALRLGLLRGSWTFGGGLRLLGGRAGVDLAYLSHRNLGPTYKLSVNFNWK